DPRTMRFSTSPRTATPSSSRTTSCSWTGCRPRAFRASSSDRATISSQRGCDAGKGISAHRSSPARLKPYHVETLKAIALLGGTKEYVNLSSGELGKLIGVSQQSASQRILELIREGLVARDLATRRQRIRLTPRGGAHVRRREMLPRVGRPCRLRGHHADPHAPYGRPRGHLEALPPRLAWAEGWGHRRAHRQPLMGPIEFHVVSFMDQDVIRGGRAADATVLDPRRGSSCCDAHPPGRGPRIRLRTNLEPRNTSAPSRAFRRLRQR